MFDRRSLGSLAGFTLIELLVVISIISLLIAMLLPALATARESAKSIQCATQARQMAVAADLYADDEKDQYPARQNPEWPKTLKIYGAAEPMRLCPTDMDPEPVAEPRSYIFNGWNDVYSVSPGVGSTQPPPNGWAMNRRIIRLPASVILFGEKETGSDHFYMDMFEGLGNDFTELEQRRHNEGSNYAYADMHTLALHYPDALTPVNQWGATQLGRDSIYTTP